MIKIKNFLLMCLLPIFVCSCENDLDKAYYFIGDSIIARWPLDETLPSQLVHNYGKSGAGIDYLNDFSGQFFNKDVVVMIGTNDIRMLNNEVIDSYADTYMQTISSLTDKKIYLFSILPRQFNNDNADINEKISLLNSKIKGLLSNYPKVVYIDVYDEFIDGEHINYQYYSDGLHLNTYGYEILSYYLLKTTS